MAITLLITGCFVAGCGGEATVILGPEETTPVEVPAGAVDSVTAESLARGSEGFPVGARLVLLTSDQVGALLESGHDFAWLVIFWDEARQRRQFVAVVNGEVDFSEDDVQLTCGTDELVDVDSSVVVPDAVARVHAAFTNPPPYENLFYQQWLPCMGDESLPAVHYVTVLWSDGPADTNKWFHVHYL